MYAKWLAQKRARLREAAAAKRAQEEQQRLEAQEAQRRREMARERMAAWLKAKDAQLRTKREAETAAQAEAERDKAEWLSQRRNRLAATLRRIESRAQRKTGRGSRLSVSHSRHGHGTAGATAHGDGEAEPRDERTATGTAPTKPAAVRRHASRPNALSGKTMRTTVADSSSRGASVVGTAAAPLLSSPLESKLLPPRQAQHQEHSLALPVLSPRSGRRRDIGRAKSAKPQAHGSRQRSRPGKPRHRQASSYDSADSRLRKWQASTVTTGGMYMPQLLLAATPTSNPLIAAAQFWRRDPTRPDQAMTVSRLRQVHAPAAVAVAANNMSTGALLSPPKPHLGTVRVVGTMLACLGLPLACAPRM